MKPANGSIAASTIAITQTVTVWTLVMPNISDVRAHSPGRTPDFADDMRQSECIVGFISVTVGYIMAKVEGDWTPLICSAMLVLALICAYEYVLFTDTRSHLSPVTSKEAN